MCLLATAALAAGSAQAHGSLTVLVGEPFGNFGTMMPVGHTAVYLDQLCADGPLKLRTCRAGEPKGVVVARYHGIGPRDWLATPVMQFLYATDRPEDVPEYISDEVAWSMREQYRTRFLRALVPDGTERDKGTEEWWESAGMAYNRRLWGFQVNTSPEQDQSFLRKMNADPNQHRYSLGKNNCANFAADVVNFYFPGTVERGDRLTDFGLMSPRQVARSLDRFGQTHPKAQFKVIEIPQIAGSTRRSRPVRSAVEGLLKTKRYLFTLLVVQPELPVALTALYLSRARWKLESEGAIACPATFAPSTSFSGATQKAEAAGEQDAFDDPDKVFLQR